MLNGLFKQLTHICLNYIITHNNYYVNSNKTPLPGAAGTWMAVIKRSGTKKGAVAKRHGTKKGL